VHDVGAILGAWSSFYVIIGSAAAALTGLMFVVITLVKGSNHDLSAEGLSTYTTPSVAHFCCALFTSAVMSAPFRSLVPVAVLLSLTGLAGSFYAIRIARKSMNIRTYQPDTEDLIWHLALPLASYLLLLAGAIALPFADGALYAPAAAVALFIFIGIHNAWDVVTFIALDNPEDDG